MTDSFLQEIERFRAARDRRLRAEDGWLALVDRWVLQPGPNPIDIGTAWLEDGAVRIELTPGVSAAVEGRPATRHVWPATAPGPGPFLFVGARRYELLRQADRAAVRVRDPQSPARLSFEGLDNFPPDPRYRVVAHLIPPDTPRVIPLATGLGAVVDHVCPGTLIFEIDGAPLALDPVIEDDAPDRLFILFVDATSGNETYGAGRFLYADAPDASGNVVLDFNRAYNPPCALTEFASCPVAPRQNRLPIRIEAGEKLPHDH